MVSGLKDHLGYWLRFVSNHVSHGFATKLEGEGVTVAEWVVLRELYEAGTIAPSVLAERLGMTRGAISKLAERLAGKALLTRTAGGRDRRFQDLAITDAGRALIPLLAELADRNDAEFFDLLDPETRATVEAAMKQIARQRGLRTIPTS